MKKMAIHIYWILLLSVIMSCTSKVEKQPANSASRLQVHGYKVIPQSFNNDLVTTAELLPNEQVVLKAPVSGQVLDISFKEGQNVKKGDPITRLDDRNWKAQLVGIKAELVATQKDFNRKKELLSIEGSTQEEVDKIVSTIATLESQARQLEVNIELANVKAPFSGKLGMRNFSTGAFLKEGDVITTVVELNQLKVDFTVAQEYLNDIENGEQIIVLVQNDTLKATIYAIDPMIDMQSRTIHVRALLPQSTSKIIMPGTFAEVLVRTNFIKDALLIPTQAVVPEINDLTVYLYKSGKALKKVIKMGERTPDKVRVLKGVNAGDTVITTGLLEIKNGMELTLQSVK